ncbi:MAG: PASTA domain-containing protein [Candidatus Hydrogenedentota bacterium]
MRTKFLRNWGMGVLAVLVGVLGLGCPVVTTPTVPDVVGLEEEAAVTEIEDVGLVAEVETSHHDTVAEGLVISQDPAAETEVERGSTVAIVVSLGPSFVPEALWIPYEDAEAAILEQDLVVGEVTPRYDPSAPEGYVLETEPEAGTQIAVGSAVNLFVSRGPDPMVGSVQVPVKPAPLELVVDDIPRTQNVDLSDGSWQWFKFQGEADTKYYVHATGNGPLNMSVFIGTDVEGLETQVADMLWTTDPCYPEYEFVIDYICDPCADPCEELQELCEACEEVCEEEEMEKIVKSEKAIMIPNFVAPKDATYYVVIQAAKKDTLTCLPDDCEDEITDDMLYLHYEVEYYELTTYSVQVTTSTSYEDAVMIQAYDPVDPEVEPAFYQGEVRVNNHDWLAFEAEEDSNYMIEFLTTDLSRDYSVRATIYSPLGDVACLAYACDDCYPEPLYAPNAGTYYILVEVGDEEAPSGSGCYDPDDELEFGQFPYILRVLEDDHGNFPSLATTIPTPALREEEGVAGYLSREDVDAFDFKPATYSTYRIETRGVFDLWMDGDFDALYEDYDGRNDFGIVQTGRSVALRQLGIMMTPDIGDPFWLRVGEYEVAAIGDDHVDDDVHNIDATEEIPVPGSSTGLLWPLDTDMLSFALDANYMHKVESTNANEQKVQVVNTGATGFDVLADATWDPDQAPPKELTSYVNPYVTVPQVLEDTTGYAVLSGVDEDLEEYEAEFGVTVEKGEYPVFTGVADAEAGVLPISSSL